MSPEGNPDKQSDAKAELHVLPHRRRSTDSNEQNDAANAVESNRQDFNSYNPAQNRENMRGWVAIAVVGVYGLCILLLVGSGIASTLMHSTTIKESSEGFDAIGNMLSSHVVPIITLVLGFYFGSERK